MRVLTQLSALLLALPIVSGVKNTKRGIAFAEADNPNDIAKANQTDSVISWIYNWANAPPDYLARSLIPFVPMQWGAGGVEGFASTVQAQGARTIFAFNEPDFADQSNIPAQQAADLWKRYIEPLVVQGVKLGAPAVTNAPWGRRWLGDFLAACTGCTIDFIPFHWYGEGIGNFYDYMWQVHYQFPDYPLWVTEFASTSQDDAVVTDFLNQTIRYMDSLDWIQGYAWFGYFREESGNSYSLLDANGNLNQRGRIYVTNVSS